MNLALALDYFTKTSHPVDLMPGDIVRFAPYYESDKGGVGVIKQITDCEFKNPEYDPADDESELFISLPTAIVVSCIPGEQWLDYVPLSHLELIPTSKELAQEYALETSITDALAVFELQLFITSVVSKYRQGTGLSHSDMQSMWNNNAPVQLPVYGGAQ